MFWHPTLANMPSKQPGVLDFSEFCARKCCTWRARLVPGSFIPGPDFPWFSFHLLVCPASWGTLLTHHTSVDLAAHPSSPSLVPANNHSCLLFGYRSAYTSKMTCLWEDRPGRGPHRSLSGLYHLFWEFRDTGCPEYSPEESMGFRWAHLLTSMGGLGWKRVGEEIPRQGTPWQEAQGRGSLLGEPQERTCV